jgi:kynurenine formamidase
MIREGFRQSLSIVFCLVLLVACSSALAQTREKGPWWPHAIWGPDDQAGATNWITQEKILEAVKLVRTGKVYELGHVYERDMPLIGNRSYTMSLVGYPTYGSPFSDGMVYQDDLLCTEIGQVGTQLDGLGHAGLQMKMADGNTKAVHYNGFTSDETYSPYGLLELGVENYKPVITRGILIDIPGYKGLDTLPRGYEITLADVRGALERQRIDEAGIQPGDAIFIRSGWSEFWSDPEKILDAEGWPQASKQVGEWLVEKRISLVGEDLATSVFHIDLRVHHGIPLLEFMTFTELAKDEVYEFLFVLTPLRLKGSTGSPSRPLAIH